MPVESWIDPQETAELAASATATIDAALAGREIAREAYWAAVRKGYNTPYNDPPPRKRPAAEAPLVIVTGEETLPDLPIAAMAAANADVHVG